MQYNIVVVITNNAIKNLSFLFSIRLRILKALNIPQTPRTNMKNGARPKN